MLKKRYLKSRAVCKVTFYTASELEAEQIFLVGDFNEWDEAATPMKRLKDGRFKVTVDLPVDCHYEFRYLVNGSVWANDWEADYYTPNPFYGDNSGVKV